MPFVIAGNTNDHRIVYAETTLDFARQFFHPLARGEPLTPGLLALTPDPYFVKPPDRGGIPEIFESTYGVWTVKDCIKSIIEELEPGVHTFIPVNLRIRGSDKSHGQYYLLYPGQAIDAVVIDETDFGEGKGRAGFGKEISPGVRSYTLSPFGRTVLDQRLIEGRHLWRGGRGKWGGGGILSKDTSSAQICLRKKSKLQAPKAGASGSASCRRRKVDGITNGAVRALAIWIDLARGRCWHPSRKEGGSGVSPNGARGSSLAREATTPCRA